MIARQKMKLVTMSASELGGGAVGLEKGSSMMWFGGGLGRDES